MPTDAATTPQRSGEPRQELRPPAHRVERRAVLLWVLQGLLIAAPVLTGAIVAHTLWGDDRPWLLLLVGAAVLLFVASVVVEPLWRYRVHRWETSADAVYARTGWVVQEWRISPISRIQTVDAVRGPLEQLLGLSTLRVTTASSRGAVDIIGMDAAVAATTAERLSAITGQTPGDAT